MKQSDILTLQSFLVALVQLPSPLSATLQQEINTVGKTLAEDTNSALQKIKKLVKNELIWQLYDDAYSEFLKRYQAKPRNKIIRPRGNIKATSNIPDNNEEENVALPASVVEESLNRLTDIFEHNPTNQAKQSYQQFQDNAPKDVTNTDYYSWAEFLCSIY